MKNQKLRFMFGSAAIVATAVSATGCIQDTDCGICDPNKLVLESLTGINYANKKVSLVQPEADKPKYFLTDLEECELTEDALGSARGTAEWCTLSPLITWQGIELVFNNLLNASSVELVRKDPSNPNLFEVYDWKSQVLEVRGPITRYNGDFIKAGTNQPERVSRRINLSCVENLSADGQPFDAQVLADNPEICAATVDGELGGKASPVPLMMQLDGVTKAYRGRTDWRAASCSAPEEGADICCTACDYELGVNVAKYGVGDEIGEDEKPVRLSDRNGVTCDEGADVMVECRDFKPYVDREHEFKSYVYDWEGSAGPHAAPMYDRLRETHPSDRPAGAENTPVHCDTDDTCTAAGLTGTQCIGDRDGEACSDGADCENKRCKAEFFGQCVVSNATTGAQGYCVDKRFDNREAPGCYVATADFQACSTETPGLCDTVPANLPVAFCDLDGNDLFEAANCCKMSLGSTADGAACDPVFQPNVRPVERFGRDNTLPDATRSCYCGNPADQASECASQIERMCTQPFGSLVRHDGSSNEGIYITRFVTKVGGVVYDPAIKGIDYRPGDIGDEARALTESCAEGRGLIGERNIQDGWIAHDGLTPENYENFDRGMCSGSEYTVVFASGGEHVRDKVGNDLEGRSNYTFRTPEFHVVPGSGFPTDNLRIGACDQFEMRLSNKFDMAPSNLNKIEVWQLEQRAGTHEVVDFSREGHPTQNCETLKWLPETCWEPAFRVAGGQECSPDPAIVNANDGDIVPCLTVDVADQSFGTVKISVDAVLFSRKLFDVASQDDYGRDSTGRYRMVLPGLGYNPATGAYDSRFASMADAKDSLGDGFDTAYKAAFHDVCGMPMIVGGEDEDEHRSEDFYYDFSVDEPKCRDDKDGDGVQASCDNATFVSNPEQTDSDQDNHGDIIDLCPLVPSKNNSSDSDKDGVGNDCDNCRKPADSYNVDIGAPDPRYWVRVNAAQGDADQDGIGDVCDNCVTVANCGDFGPTNPHALGESVPDDSEVLCQADTDQNMIGDICEGLEGAGSAGPVGFLETDDFDQDGLVNLEDICPRQPVENVACTTDAECPADTACSTANICNHRDSDLDGVGNVCDTCPFAGNPEQTMLMGMELDDEDGDGVGRVCETSQACSTTKDPRPLGLYAVAVEGICCTTQFGGDGAYVDEPNDDGTYDCVGLCDPDGLPIMRDCQDEPAEPEDRIPDGINCRSLPDAVQAPNQYGVTDLAPGCEQALADAGLCDPGDPACDVDMSNKRLTTADESDIDVLWGNLCFLPQRDQDFDGLGDICDKCKYGFDPFNEQYVDGNGKVWPDNGKYCSGLYDPQAVCDAEEAEENGGETGDTGESDGGEATG